MSGARTPIDWDLVFELRCKSKRGEGLTPEEQAICERAFRKDPARYAGMSDAVFEATKPAGAR